MAFKLQSTDLKRPTEMDEINDTQMAENRTLSGKIKRDYFGDNKRTWRLRYENTNKADYDTIKSIYDSYLSTGNTKSWEVTEINYTVSQTQVHVDLKERSFSQSGSSYISDFELILTEA